MSLPSPCRVVNGSKSHLEKVFCFLFMLQVAEAMHQAAKTPQQGLGLHGIVSLYLHHRFLPGF